MHDGRRTGWAAAAAVALGCAATAVAGSYSATSGRVTVDTRTAAAANTLVLTVRVQSSDAALSGATVIAGGVTRTTDASGRVTIAPATNGAALKVFKSGYQTNNTTCQVPGSGTFSQTERLSAVLAAGPKPVINSVKLRPYAFTLQATGLNLPLFVVPDVTWGTESGGTLKYTTAVKSGSATRGSPTTLRLNPTTDLPCSGLVAPRGYTIQLTAETANGASAPVSAEVVALALPAWLVNAGAAYTGTDAPTAGELTVMPFSIRREFVPSGASELDLGIVTIESSLGIFASGSLGGSAGEVSGFRGTYGFEGGIDAGIKVKANHGGPGGIKPYGAIEGEGKVRIGGEWYPALTCDGYLELKIRGSVGVIVPVRAILLLDPTGAGASFNAWVGSWPKSWRDSFDGFAYLDASIGANIQTATPLRLSDGRIYLDFQNGLYGLGTDVRIKGHVGTDVLYVEGLLAGGGTCWFRSTAEGDTFDHAEYAIEGEVSVGFFQWERSWGVKYTKTVPDLGAEMARMTRLAEPADAGMTLIPRDYAAKNYGAFLLRSVDVRAKRIAADSRIAPKGIVAADVFVQNVFPNTTASLAGPATSDVTMLFSFDNTNLPPVQAMDIYFTRYNGASWSAPVPVAANTQSELHPQVAIDASNRPAAVWMRIRDADFADTTNEVHYLSQLDVVGSSYDAAGGWPAAQTLSTGACLNFAPILTRSPAGDLAAWWQSNPSNSLFGGVVSSNNAPSEWWWARWDAAARQFLPAGILMTNVTAAMSPSLAHGGTNAWLFWVGDRDNDFSTSNDTYLCRREWDGATWGTNVTMTAPEQTVTRVESVMLSNGAPMAVWWQSGELVYAMGPGFATAKTARAESADLVWQEMHLVRSPADGNVLLVFPKSTTNGVNLAYRVYDAAADVWGDDFAFESAHAVDFGLAPTFVGPQMWAAYTRGVLAYSNATVDVGGEAVTIGNIPYRARTDLMLARFELDADVAAVDVGVPASFPPVIRVVVANESDTVVSNLVVSIRGGSAAGTEIVSWTNAVPMRPHTTDTVDIPWGVSSNAAVLTLAAVLDPDGRIAEFREGNNAVTRTTLATDLRIAAVAAERTEGLGYEWFVRVENLIARPVPGVVVEVRRDATNGTLVAAAAAVRLPAYESLDLRLAFGTAGWDATNTLVTVVRAPAAA
ncbi:MAG: hypothetical protein BWK77_08775, partial [Verrucomicrobia bacterium A1]